MSKKWVCLISAFLVLGTAGAARATVSPVGWWMFDEKTGTTAVDSSSNKNNGTLFGGATWGTGQIKGAVQCDGTNDYVNLPIGALISKLTSATFAIWANYSQQGGAWQRIFDIGTGETVNMFLTPAIGGSNTGQMRFAITTGGSGAESQLTAPARLATGWHHIAVVINGDTRAMQLYLDGAVVASGTTAVLPSALGNTTQNWLGRSEYAADAYYQGALDDFRIYDRPLAADEIQKVMLGGGFGTASSPQPADKATDIVRDVTLSWTPSEGAKTHNVYLGASAADVNNASVANPLNVLVSKGQDANSYDPPAVFELGKTYYWRVDEVNGAPSSTVFKGDVWSFTVEPVSYPIKNITATASSSLSKDMGPEKTVDGSGMNAADEHSTTPADMWLSAKGGPDPAWIQYAFDKAYKLDKMRVWNSNQVLESILGFGSRNVLVEYSLDATTWTALGEFEFAQAPAVPYASDIVVDFGGKVAQYVKLTIKSNWGGLLPQYGLSEVRFLYIPVWAREPNPVSDKTAVDPQMPLSWRPGREAASHQVYVSTDKQQVLDGTAPVSTVSGTSFAPPVGLGQTYYWKVTEVNDAMTPKSWDGDVWSFTTSAALIVDDFESYTDEKDHEIFGTWIDGFTSGASGSQVGYLQAPFAERTIVHGGRQSMPLIYDNSKAPRISEAERTFQPPQDWSKYGITTLVIWFRGEPNNTAAPLYAKINGTKVVFNNGAPSTAFGLWKQWNIDLAALGTNLKSVKTLTIGVGDGATGGTGTLFVDDILLYATAPQAVVPADPGTSSLVLLYAMEGNVQDTSGKGNHGTASGAPLYGSGPKGYGQALTFDGLNDYVNVPIGTLLSTLTNTTVASWINWSGTGGGWQRVWDFGTGTTNYMFLTPAQATTGPMTFAIRTTAVAEKRFAAASSLPTGWHHVAVVIDAAAMTATVYLDGAVVSTSSVAVLPKDLGVTNQNWIGRSQFTADAFFTGAVDDFRIFNRALSASEIRYLAGDR
jgi:hypothetical protein